MARRYKPSSNRLGLTKAQKLEHHNQWLMKMGVHPSQLKSKDKSHIKMPCYKSDIETVPTSDRVGNGFVKSKHKYSGSGVHVGQAYNKGNLVVLSTTEANDAATGKRR
jgi:hypothetical protein